MIDPSAQLAPHTETVMFRRGELRKGQVGEAAGEGDTRVRRTRRACVRVGKLFVCYRS